MIAFNMLSAAFRAIFALWALLLCLTNIGSAALAAVKKRYRFTVFSLLLFIPCYFMWQVIFDLSLFGGTEKVAAVSTVLCGLPVIEWLVVFALLTLTAVLLLAFNIHYDKNFITPGTIKLCLDKMPCGICCWRDNGRVLFSNICMNHLCTAITGNPLLNGNQFSEAVKESILTVDGRVWRFARREIVMDGERLCEMIASDITAEYAKTAALEKDKAELSRLNRELREYYLSIDESVHRQEILQAKMNIHDEMNRLMLSTVAADRNDTAALDSIFSLWEQNALLLCMEADERTGARKDDVTALTKALGINLIWRDEIPQSLGNAQRELFFFTAQEAIINAVKHAQAERMEISFEETPQTLTCRFKNDGKMPQSGEVHFEGGLANIALLAEKQNAVLDIDLGDEFTLILSMKNQPKV